MIINWISFEENFVFFPRPFFFFIYIYSFSFSFFSFWRARSCKNMLLKLMSSITYCDCQKNWVKNMIRQRMKTWYDISHISGTEKKKKCEMDSCQISFQLRISTLRIAFIFDLPEGLSGASHLHIIFKLFPWKFSLNCICIPWWPSNENFRENRRMIVTQSCSVLLQAGSENLLLRTNSSSFGGMFIPYLLNVSKFSAIFKEMYYKNIVMILYTKHINWWFWVIFVNWSHMVIEEV